MPAVIKVTYKSEIRRSFLERDDLAYEDVRQAISHLYPDLTDYSAKYMDEEGEHQGDGEGEEYHADDDQEGEEEGHDEGHDEHHDEPQGDQDPNEIKKQLEHFFQKFTEAKMLNLPEQTVGAWQKYWETEASPKLEVDDADQAAAAEAEIEKKMVEMIAASGSKPFNKETHTRVIDYFGDLLDAGKAMRKTSELEALMAAFKDASKDPVSIIAEIEKLAEAGAKEGGPLTAGDVPLQWLWKDGVDPTFNEDEEYDKEGEAYEHEHEHDVDDEANEAEAEAGSASGSASGSGSDDDLEASGSASGSASGPETAASGSAAGTASV